MTASGRRMSARVAELELPWRPHERRVVHPHEHDRSHAPLGGLHPGRPLVEPHRPLDPLHPPHAIEVVVRERLDLVDEAEARVHHPDLGVPHVLDLAGRAPHDVAEDRGLVSHQHRGDADREDQPDVLAAVPRQHLHRHERHRESPPRPSDRARPRPQPGGRSTGRHRVPSAMTDNGRLAGTMEWDSSPVPRRKVGLAPTSATGDQSGVSEWNRRFRSGTGAVRPPGTSQRRGPGVSVGANRDRGSAGTSARSRRRTHRQTPCAGAPLPHGSGR